MLNFISSILWIVTTIVLILSSISLSLYLKFPQRKLSKKVKLFDKKRHTNSIKLLNLTLAAKIGVGSISGIAISIIIGGKGTILWIWLSAIILSIITYLETKTGIQYREKIGKDVIGGPIVYIKKEISNKLSLLYCFLIIFTYFFAFILIQSNTIIVSLKDTFLISENAILFILIPIVYLSISKGINTISKTVSLIVPVMGFLYIIIGSIVIYNNFDMIPTLLLDILKESISLRSISTIPLIVGFQRSIFSNETGMGSTSMVVSLSSSNDYKLEAYIQLIGMYFITLVITTISALLILTTNYETLGITNLNGIEIINYAITYHFGSSGSYLSILIITLFAYSTIITCYYYGDICLKYLFRNKKINISKIIVIIVIILSAYISTTNIWAIVDIATSLSTLINVYALYKIKDKLKE